MNMSVWRHIVGLAVLLGIACAARAANEPAQFYLGVTREVTLKALGNPTFKYPPDVDGKELWYYNKAIVTFVRGQVVSWQNFNEAAPNMNVGRPIGLGVSQEDVAAVLGFPPGARRYTALVIGQRPIGEEEWSYSGGTLIFQDGLVVGWRGVTSPFISIGVQLPGAKAPELGCTARELLAALGTPPTLTCYVKSGDQLWVYAGEQFLVRGGRMVWRGLPQPRTPAERPPVREEAPAPGPGDAGQPQEDIGVNEDFINDPDFDAFRLRYQQTLTQLEQRNPKFTETAAYRAMLDCLNKRPWWSIMAQADLNQDYARGVDTIAEGFNQFLDEKYGKNRRNR